MEDLDTRKLKMFVTTYQAGSMRRASEHLRLTPSALSHGIRGLEEQLGQALFVRKGPKLVATPAGTRFNEDALEVLKQLHAMAVRHGTDHPNEVSELRIGTTNTGCLHLFPAIVREFRESLPDLSLRLEIGDTDHLIQSMR